MPWTLLLFLVYSDSPNHTSNIAAPIFKTEQECIELGQGMIKDLKENPVTKNVKATFKCIKTEDNK